ncbi:MAG: helix-turn-helix domain-containing protein [Pyrinomonadaceae bacterium]
MELLTTSEAAKRLRVTPIRVRQMIREGKIQAKQVGRDYVIEESSLDSVKTYGKAGRPAKESESGNSIRNAKNEKPFKTIFDIMPELAGKYNDLPSDLSTNKDYLKGLGSKSAEKQALGNRRKNSPK